MEDRDARNLIESEIRQKMLGPGYAQGLIYCANDAKDEIIPGNPKKIYSTGVLIPQSSPTDTTDDASAVVDDYTEGDEEEEVATDVAVVDDEKSEDLVKKHSGAVETSESEVITPSMDSHFGLVTCVSEGATKVKICVNYGVYRRLSWEEKQESVMVFVGECKDTIREAISSFAENEGVRTTLEENNLPAFDECFELSDDGYLSISSKMTQSTKSPLRIPRNNYPVEAELVNILLGDHYRRTHCQKGVELNLETICGKIELGVNDGDANVKLYWNSFVSSNKRFLKVLLRNEWNECIFQPQITVEVPAGCGEIESYVEPITSMEDDLENNINEFVYRKVLNYGKGVNCALDWIVEQGECKKVYTTFMPTSNIEKFSNAALSIGDNDQIRWVCELRNISIWSTATDDEILDNLKAFVGGYAEWHKRQCADAENDRDNYAEEIDVILKRQTELQERLYDNIEYLRKTPEALECFKIANTAMLLQMVVARHPLFAKDKEVLNHNQQDGAVYNSLNFFKDAKYIANNGIEEPKIKEPKYYPFQLAFLLMNVKSTFEQDDQYRKDFVDLIWFPTGGGKTEAYLALTALTIVHRRRRGDSKGISVIMRYTLRMLTSQQFERASYLICALEFLRTHIEEQNVQRVRPGTPQPQSQNIGTNQLGLGNSPITIGIYVGLGVTPNTVEQNRGEYNRFIANPTRNNNPFPVTYCPWCGCRMVAIVEGDRTAFGYTPTGSLKCINNNCYFCPPDDHHKGLPIYYVDEQIYNNPPTLLFATVDKFATLANGQHGNLLREEDVASPDLIIQDELHLLMGALGSIVGFYESIIELMCTKDGRSPKIIASTATTRNTQNLIKGLYNRKVSIFPAQGLEYSDNCFSHIIPGAKRRHIGIMPSANTNSNQVEIRLAALLLLTRVKLFKQYIAEQNGKLLDLDDVFKRVCGGDNGNELTPLLDNYWTTVFYFNSLKDLGRSYSRVYQEVREAFRGHQHLYAIPRLWKMLTSGFDSRVLEFTSRIDSKEIKGFLTAAEKRVHLCIREETDQQPRCLDVSSGSDLIFASNMISVGIDISRWNVMVMVGHPRSTSEYVQASSRVARSTDGLVINLLNPLRLREHSVFENYKSFHSAYYKFVEPLSITPLTCSTIKHKVLVNIVNLYRRYINPNLENEDAEDFAYKLVEDVFEGRFDYNYIENELIRRIREIRDAENNDTAQSLRDITQDAFISINKVYYQQ